MPAMQRALRQLQRKETSMFQDATLVACVLSLVSCAWLVWRISCNGCFLSRQLWHLALSDMFECSVVLLANLPIASLLGTRGIWLLGTWFFVSSLLFECHVAAGFAAVFWRWRRLMSSLSRTVWLLWMLGLIMELVCFLITDQRVWEWLEVVISVWIMCATIVFYLLAALRSVWFPAQEQRRAQRIGCTRWRESSQRGLWCSR